MFGGAGAGERVANELVGAEQTGGLEPSVVDAGEATQGAYAGEAAGLGEGAVRIVAGVVIEADQSGGGVGSEALEGGGEGRGAQRIRGRRGDLRSRARSDGHGRVGGEQRLEPTIRRRCELGPRGGAW